MLFPWLPKKMLHTKIEEKDQGKNPESQGFT
jgi:hypothetical protein